MCFKREAGPCPPLDWGLSNHRGREGERGSTISGFSIPSTQTATPLVCLDARASIDCFHRLFKDKQYELQRQYILAPYPRHPSPTLLTSLSPLQSGIETGHVPPPTQLVMQTNLSRCCFPVVADVGKGRHVERGDHLPIAVSEDQEETTCPHAMETSISYGSYIAGARHGTACTSTYVQLTEPTTRQRPPHPRRLPPSSNVTNSHSRSA